MKILISFLIGLAFLAGCALLFMASDSHQALLSALWGELIALAFFIGLALIMGWGMYLKRDGGYSGDGGDSGDCGGD